MPVTWNPIQARYRDTETGKFISRDTVLGYVRESITATGDVARTVAERVANGQLSSREFNTVMRQEIKDEYIRQYVLGRGGLGSMTQQDWGSVGGMIADQYRYLNRFVDQLETGALTEGQIRARAAMYINSAREGYERGYRRGILASGSYTEVKWHLGDAEHCADCESLAGRGWQPIEDMDIYPGGGSTQCKTNCKCYLTYR